LNPVGVTQKISHLQIIKVSGFLFGTHKRNFILIKLQNPKSAKQRMAAWQNMWVQRALCANCLTKLLSFYMHSEVAPQECLLHKLRNVKLF